MYGVHRTCAEMAALSRGISHETTKQRCQYTTSSDIKKTHYKEKRKKDAFTHSESHATVSLLESREYFYILASSNNNEVQSVTTGSRVWGIKRQPVEGGSRAGMPETRWSANLLL